MILMIYVIDNYSATIGASKLPVDNDNLSPTIAKCVAQQTFLSPHTHTQKPTTTWSI